MSRGRRARSPKVPAFDRAKVKFHATASPDTPSGANNAAKAMLDRAVEFKEVLIAHGLGATLIDELTKALAEFDTNTGSVHAGRVLHVGARAELEEVVDDCSQLLAAWESARTVVGAGRVNGNGAALADPAPSAATEASPPVM